MGAANPVILLGIVLSLLLLQDLLCQASLRWCAITAINQVTKARIVFRYVALFSGLHIIISVPFTLSGPLKLTVNRVTSDLRHRQLEGWNQTCC
jgi:hypothetical protein